MANVERLTIALSAELASLVRSAVEAGDYASSSEVVRDALRDWKRKRSLQDLELDAMRAEVEKGLEDMRSGETKAAEDVFHRLGTKYKPTD